MTGVSFHEFRITDSQRLDFHYEIDSETEKKTGEIHFQSNIPIPFDPDSVALALSTMCGSAYRRVRMDLRVSPRARKVVESFLRCELSAPARGGVTPERRRRGNVLSFSGGFDSLAALRLMPDDTNLVSMDFGGRFSTEKPFFDKFRPTVISTNIVGTDFQRNSWSFMGIGAILTAPIHAAKYMTFGSILEAGVDNLRRLPLTSRGQTFPPFAGAGYRNAPYVAGITEIGTAMILVTYCPEVVNDSLASLALPGEEKLYRKYVLASIAAERAGLTVDLKEPPPPATRRPFGRNFTADFLSLYIRRFGGAQVRDAFLTDVPAEIDALSERLALTFYERINTTIMQKFPVELAGGLYERAAVAGLVPYTEDDWREYMIVRDALAPYHPTVAR
ncbi:hypothetical protein [Micromonospora mirobrigensis]|uniref:Uncharacterized protein n=1 Tax=Micromonospora mirobrigensis TaxID=262898 RepID=A0A1C5AF12_9ACTN|nr:hypothetical protein [Micromonospora mirobrigensis]SCF43800.1 hypothetical protein GA0070564_109160 [Micromonospora mirobrigensis]